MASNPIQKKVRNAALVGVLVTLVLMGAIVALLLMQLDRVNKEKEALKNATVSVYTISQDVKSGYLITEDMLQQSSVLQEHIPSNAIIDPGQLSNYSLVDSDGNKIYADVEGNFIDRDCEYMEIFQDEETKKYYTYARNGKKEEVSINYDNRLYSDNEGMYLIKKVEGKTRLKQEPVTGKYYILKVRYNANVDATPVREREYIELLQTPFIAKIDMDKNTVVTYDMLAEGSLLTADVRRQEYNAVVLPTDLTTGDYVDIRLQVPSGQDYIVVSKKTVEFPVIEGMESENTIWMNLSEDEILTMSCAIVEAYRINGSKLYATKYTDPGMQDAATPTYPVNAETYALIKADPNVVDVAEAELEARYNVEIRNNYINSELEKPENSETNVPGKINESITKTQEERKKYLQSLANGAY